VRSTVTRRALRELLRGTNGIDLEDEIAQSAYL
jgi:hypothetical protein